MHCCTLMMPQSLVKILKVFSGMKSIGLPKMCLGGCMRKAVTESGMEAWNFGSSQHVQSACKNVRECVESGRQKIPRANTPLSSNCRPELDLSNELNVADAAHHQSLIGIPRWMVELGRVDICLEVSMMSSHLPLPREGHLQWVSHIMTQKWCLIPQIQ